MPSEIPQREFDSRAFFLFSRVLIFRQLYIYCSIRGDICPDSSFYGSFSRRDERAGERGKRWWKLRLVDWPIAIADKFPARCILYTILYTVIIIMIYTDREHIIAAGLLNPDLQSTKGQFRIPPSDLSVCFIYWVSKFRDVLYCASSVYIS